jgi:hypothetical protein
MDLLSILIYSCMKDTSSSTRGADVPTLPPPPSSVSRPPTPLQGLLGGMVGGNRTLLSFSAGLLTGVYIKESYNLPFTVKGTIDE